MRKSLQTLGLSLFIVVALIIIGIGLLPGMNPWVSVAMAAVLLAVPLINKWTTSRRFVEWRDDLSVGIDSIDDDHKKLLTHWCYIGYCFLKYMLLYLYFH